MVFKIGSNQSVFWLCSSSSTTGSPRILKLGFLHHHVASLIIVIVVGIIPGCVICQNENESNCRQPFACGRLRGIPYPFYGGNRSLSCGYPGFELSCQGDDDPLIITSSLTYRVLAIDGWTQTLRLARNDLWTALCNPSLVNTTLNTSLYNFYWPAHDKEIALIYGCISSQTPPIPLPNRLNCDADGINGSSFFLTNLSDTSITCGARISVRVNQTAAEELERNPSTLVLQASLQTGFSIQWSADNQNCSGCVQSGGFCGLNQSSASFACYCTLGTYESTCPNTPNQNESKKGLSDLQKYVIIGVSVCISVLVISSITIYYFKRYRRLHYLNQESNQNVEKFLLKHGSLAPKRYSYNDIKKMTKFFKDKLGQGGYGIVYKGELPDGQLVAVKVLTETHNNAEEFINEVASISRTSHVNIVNLLGFSYERKKRALVYEFMPNKSLDKFIYKSGSSDHPECSLEWETLYEIAVGVARGLEYLHRGCNTRIVHFDIKPQNILLNEDFSPKISDFGLAQLFKQKQSIISMYGARGTVGYIAPEVFSRNFGVVSHKSDVYSYGMMLLEIAEAKKMFETEPIQSSEVYFPEKIYEHALLKNETLDDLMTEEDEAVRKMLMVGLWCIQTAPSDRPSMSKAVEMLQGSLSSIKIPPKPFFPSPKLLGPVASSTYTDNESST